MPSAPGKIAVSGAGSKRLAWVTATLGMVTVAILLWFASDGPRNDCNASTLPPILALQNARTVGDLFAVIGDPASPYHFVLRMELGILALADLMVLIPAYTERVFAYNIVTFSSCWRCCRNICSA